MDFENWEYLAQYVIISTMSMQLGSTIKNINSAHEMWEWVKTDATSKAPCTLLMQMTNLKACDLWNPMIHIPT